MKQVLAALIISVGLVAHALISAPVVTKNGEIVNPVTKEVTSCMFESCMTLNMQTGETVTVKVKK